MKKLLISFAIAGMGMFVLPASGVHAAESTPSEMAYDMTIDQALRESGDFYAICMERNYSTEECQAQRNIYEQAVWHYYAVNWGIANGENLTPVTVPNRDNYWPYEDGGGSTNGYYPTGDC